MYKILFIVNLRGKERKLLHYYVELVCSDYPDFESRLPAGAVGHKPDRHGLLLRDQGGEIIGNTAAAQPGLRVGFYLADKEVVLGLTGARPLDVELVDHQLQFPGVCLEIPSAVLIVRISIGIVWTSQSINSFTIGSIRIQSDGLWTVATITGGCGGGCCCGSSRGGSGGSRAAA